MMEMTMENREQKWLEKEKAYKEKEEQLMAKLQETEKAFQEREKQMLTKHQICKKLLLRHKKEIEETLASWDEAEKKYKDKEVHNEPMQSLINAQGETMTTVEPGFQSQPAKSQVEAQHDSEVDRMAQPEADHVNNEQPEPEMVLFDTESVNKDKNRSRKQRRNHRQSEVATEISEETLSELTDHFTEAQDKATEAEGETLVHDTETFTPLIEREGLESQGELPETQIEARVDQVDCKMEDYIAGEPPVDPHYGLTDSPVTPVETENIGPTQAETTFNGEAQSGEAQADTEPLEPENVPIKINEKVQDFDSPANDKKVISHFTKYMTLLLEYRQKKKDQVAKALEDSNETSSDPSVLIPEAQDTSTETEALLHGVAQSGKAQANTEQLEHEIVQVKDEIMHDNKSTSQNKKKRRRRRKKNQVLEEMEGTAAQNEKETVMEPTVEVVPLIEAQEKAPEAEMGNNEPTQSPIKIQEDSDAATFTTVVEDGDNQSQTDVTEGQGDSDTEAHVPADIPVESNIELADPLNTPLESEMINSSLSELTVHLTEAQDKSTEAEAENTVTTNEDQGDIHFTAVGYCEVLESQAELTEAQIDTAEAQSDSEKEAHVTEELEVVSYNDVTDSQTTPVEFEIIDPTQAETTYNGVAQSGEAQANTEPENVPVKINKKVQDSDSQDKKVISHFTKYMTLLLEYRQKTKDQVAKALEDSNETSSDPSVLIAEAQDTSTETEALLHGVAQSGEAQANTEPLEPEIVYVKDEIMHDIKSTSQNKKKRRRRRKKNQVFEEMEGTAAQNERDTVMEPTVEVVPFIEAQDKAPEAETCNN